MKVKVEHSVLDTMTKEYILIEMDDHSIGMVSENKLVLSGRNERSASCHSYPSRIRTRYLSIFQGE